MLTKATAIRHTQKQHKTHSANHTNNSLGVHVAVVARLAVVVVVARDHVVANHALVVRIDVALVFVALPLIKCLGTFQNVLGTFRNVIT